MRLRSPAAKTRTRKPGLIVFLKSTLRTSNSFCLMSSSIASVSRGPNNMTRVGTNSYPARNSHQNNIRVDRRAASTGDVAKKNATFASGPLFELRQILHEHRPSTQAV
jgi:hypothetical protein